MQRGIKLGLMHGAISPSDSDGGRSNESAQFFLLFSEVMKDTDSLRFHRSPALVVKYLIP